MTSTSGRFATRWASRCWPGTARSASRETATASSRRGRSSRSSATLYRRRRTILSADVADLIEKTPASRASPDGRRAARDSRGQPARPAALRRAGPLPEGLLENELVFCVGPAGTGKTYLAVAMAVAALRKGRIKKIVLVRPAVEAGEHLGFLPGDLEAKINPYLRPLLDALHDLMDYDQIRRYMDNDLIEIAPLAYMRGRTLNDAMIILDEGQNATVPQMKMFLTRMGQNARIVVTGDITQVDLPLATGAGWPTPSSVSPRSRGWRRSFWTGPTSSATRWCRRSSTPMKKRNRAAIGKRRAGAAGRRPARQPAAQAGSSASG